MMRTNTVESDERLLERILRRLDSFEAEIRGEIGELKRDVRELKGDVRELEYRVGVLSALPEKVDKLTSGLESTAQAVLYLRRFCTQLDARVRALEKAGRNGGNGKGDE